MKTVFKPAEIDYFKIDANILGHEINYGPPGFFPHVKNILHIVDIDTGQESSLSVNKELMDYAMGMIRINRPLTLEIKIVNK